ncbi:MAG: hypothetical protein ABIN89_24875 [Chitinophagaceae bacterium]
MKDQENGLLIPGENDNNGNNTIIIHFKIPYAMEIIKRYGLEENRQLCK